MLKFSIQSQNLTDHKTDCLVLPCIQEDQPGKLIKSLGPAIYQAVAAAWKANRFEGKKQQTLLLDSLGQLKAGSLLLVGLGKQDDLTRSALAECAGVASKLAESSGFKSLAFALPDEKWLKALDKKEPGPCSGAVCEGISLALYHFDHYKSRDKKDPPPPRIKRVVLLAGGSGTPPKSWRGSIDRAQILATAVAVTRDLQRHPGNVATPTYLANQAKKIAQGRRLTCKALGPAELKKLKMGALLGVAQGSEEPPRLIVMEYNGARKSDPPVALVGKGITFDTGGISLKPPAGMDEMKMDMSGAATVLGAMQAIADLKLSVNVVGLVPSAENMPSGRAIKPGDILTSMSGKTIEVLNTDAEGRLVLCDALTYSLRYKPRAIVDLATLTGAVLHALGHHAAALLSNSGDMVEQLKKSGEATGERVWELPLWEEYEKAMKSSIADLKNIAGPGVMAGTITGGAFLKAFVEDTPWTHIDIAGVAWGEEKPLTPKGASGFGVRLLIDFLENFS